MKYLDAYLEIVGCMCVFYVKIRVSWPSFVRFLIFWG